MKTLHFKTNEGYRKSKKAQINIMVGLLIGFMVVTTLVALIPGMVDILNIAKQSDNLNCNGYSYEGDASHTLSYNATIGTQSSIACLAITLYIPYLVLAVLIGLVMKILYDRVASPQQYPQY
jgi:hypothetical protein